MIKAAQHKKMRPKRIDYVEDEYTSCVFGEISHYPVEKVWNFFSFLHCSAGRKNDGDNKVPRAFNFRFWPKFNNVEPDLVVDFYADTEHKECILHIIVEVKWNAELSPDCELIRQWCNRGSKNEPWRHIFLTKSSSKGIKGIDQSNHLIETHCNNECVNCHNEKHKDDFRNYHANELNKLKDSLYYVTWADIAQAAEEQGFVGISAFLFSHGIDSFIGFEWLHDYGIDSVLRQATHTEFYRGNPWWQFLDKVQLDMSVTAKDIFFS